MKYSDYFDDVLYLYLQWFTLGSRNHPSFLPNYLSRIIYILKQTIKAIYYYQFGSSPKKNLYKTKWLFVLTQNNINALNFLKSYDADYSFVSIRNKKQPPKDAETYEFDPTWQSVFNMWMIYYIKHILTNSNKFFYLKYPHLFFEVYKFRIIARLVLEKYTPSLIVFANDINIQSRVLNIEARKLGIKTAYIQHASISNLFPPLNFDLALLEGEISRDLYKVKSGTIVQLIGQPKFEKYKPLRKQIASIKTIGIAFNTLDELSAVYSLCQFLFKKNFNVILRPHPREWRKEFLSWRFINEISTSDISFDFLLKCDLIIASDSSIHLESILMNIPSVYFNLNNGYSNDYYGYVKNKVVLEACSHAEIMKIINRYNHSDNRYIFRKAKCYCYSTEEEINSEKIANNYLNKIVLEL